MVEVLNDMLIRALLAPGGTVYVPIILSVVFAFVALCIGYILMRLLDHGALIDPMDEVWWTPIERRK